MADGEGDDNTGGPARQRGKDPRFLAPRIYNLAMVLRRATNLHTKRELGLPQESARILILLGEYQPLSLNELADHSALDRGQLSRGITELVNQGYVARKRHGRSVLHRLTSEGETIFTRLIAGSDERNDFLLEGLSGEERRNLFAVMDLVIARAMTLHERERGLTQEQNDDRDQTK